MGDGLWHCYTNIRSGTISTQSLENGFGGTGFEWKASGSHSRSLWVSGVLRPQAGVEIDMPLPDIGQTEFDMVLMFWNMWQHVSRLEFESSYWQ